MKSRSLQRCVIGLSTLLLAGVVTISVDDETSAYADALHVGEHGQIDPESFAQHRDTSGWYACHNYDDLAKLDQLMKEDDGQTAIAFAQQRCVRLPAATPVVVEDATFWHDALCVRPRGQLDCLWIDNSWVTKTQLAPNGTWQVTTQPKP